MELINPKLPVCPEIRYILAVPSLSSGREEISGVALLDLEHEVARGHHFGAIPAIALARLRISMLLSLTTRNVMTFEGHILYKSHCNVPLLGHRDEIGYFRVVQSSNNNNIEFDGTKIAT